MVAKISVFLFIYLFIYYIIIHFSSSVNGGIL